ncbi:hypothetical protein [Corynebacterium aurimucosum]|nr:hypothetical protein [Corynebacterium aurimucosum]MBE7338097.1 hypothetical protein [Corynebacterium aurimucosum]
MSNHEETPGAATPEELTNKAIAFSKTAIEYAKKVNEELQKIGDDEPS